LKDQAGRFVTRDELYTKSEAIERRLAVLEHSKATLEGKASQSQVNLAMLFSVIGILLGILGLIAKFLP